MKKSLIYILALSAGLFSCEPYKDLQEAADSELVLKRDNDAIPATTTISADDVVYSSKTVAQNEIPSFLSEKYRANVYTDSKIIEVEYTVVQQSLAPKNFLDDDDYASVGNEFCKEDAGWVQNDTINIADADKEIMLTSDDYNFVGQKYGNFSSSDYDEGVYNGYTYDSRLDAMISDILQNFRNEDRTKSISVIFDVYKEGLDTLVYTADSVKGCAYQFLPSDNIEDKITGIFNNNNPDQLSDSQISAVYKVGEINGEISEHTEFFQKQTTGSWVMITSADLVHEYDTLQDADYTAFGFKYPNFSSSTPQENYLPRFLASKHAYAQEGDNYRMVYNYYTGGVTVMDIAEYKFEDMQWVLTAPISEETVSSDKFKYTHSSESNTGEWKVSLAAVITLTQADYELTGDGKYSNFSSYDDKEGEYPEGTQVDNIIDAKINHILLTNYSQYNKLDQEASVSFEYYDGVRSTKTRSYIYNTTTTNWDVQ